MPKPQLEKHILTLAKKKHSDIVTCSGQALTETASFNHQITSRPTLTDLAVPYQETRQDDLSPSPGEN
jgi:hypothetical protein